MNLESAKKTLEKINRLIDTFEPGESQVSKLEQDLIMSYTREFYDALTEVSNGTLKSSASTAKETYASAPVIEKTPQKPRVETPAPQQVKEEIIIQKYSEPVSEIENKAPQITIEELAVEEPLIEIREEVKPIPQAAIEDASNVQATVQDQLAEPTEKVATKPATASVGKSTTNPELLELFAIKKANEISEKLSQLPISDLNKAMGVNEKIFVKNELFGGDDNLFKTTLSRLNTFENFDQAKDYLATEIADSFQWTAPDRSKKAKNFIQLVYRRYK